MANTFDLSDETRDSSTTVPVQSNSDLASYFNLQLEVQYSERKGHGCDDITLLVMGLREDAIEFLAMLAVIEEDKEKFYDRAALEIQLSALIRNGCPNQGYKEFKADDMDNRRILIVTRQGVTYCMFETGLLQGSVLSVILSNPITAIKFAAWRMNKTRTIEDGDASGRKE